MLLDSGAQADAADAHGWRAHQWTAVSGHTAALLDRGAKVDATDCDGWQAHHWAALNGHAAALQLLLDGGAKVDAADSEGWQLAGAPLGSARTYSSGAAAVGS